MPPAKRVKSSAESRPAAGSAAGPSGRPTVDDLEGESEFATLARQHWLKPPKSTTAKAKAKVKVKNEVLKREIWDTLEKENFPLKSLLVLEGLQTLESYLWPGYGEDSSNYHVLLIVLLVNAKRRERLGTWGAFPACWPPSHFLLRGADRLQTSLPTVPPTSQTSSAALFP